METQGLFCEKTIKGSRSEVDNLIESQVSTAEPVVASKDPLHCVVFQLE